MPVSTRTITAMPLTRETFSHPPREMGILPFWFWNGDLENEELERQLREFHAKGIPGIFIHGRFGLKVPYLSDRWFEKVAFTVAKAKEIGIDAWIYDEMNWPSGTAERQVLASDPDLEQRYLELVALNVDGPLFTFLEATDDRYVNTGDSYPIAAFGCTEEEFQNGIRNPIDLTQNLSFNKVLPWEAPEGKWRLLYFLEKRVPYYIDALNPESTKRFIEITHERYKKAVGRDFGGAVPGFFTDEPAMHYYHVGIDNYVVPWSKHMFRIFRERRGYDLRPFLPALYTSMGERTARIRYDFWRTLTEQYSDSYYKQLRDWCDANNLVFTGHLLFEEWIRMHARCEGNIFKHLKHMHMTGVDHLYPKIGTRDEPDQHVALKIASSAAHHHGSDRLICESMGGTYWDCSLERMKWMLNWEYVLGVNAFNNHGGHYSIEGERKRDWPPSQFYQHTWWKYYDTFTAYAGRLSHLLAGGRHVAKVLVVYPLSSIWTNYIPQRRTPVGNVIEHDFNYLTDTLLRLHYDFDYVDEDELGTAAVRGGRIGIANEEYETVILPPMTHMKRKTFDVLRRFHGSGGSIIADTLLPVEFLESRTHNAVKAVRSLFGVDPEALLQKFIDGKAGRTSVVRRSPTGKGRVFTFRGKGLAAEKPEATLRRVLEACMTPDVTISDDEVFYLHRIKDGFDIYFLVNTSKKEKKGVEVTFEQVARPELWDPDTGDIRPVQVYDVKKGRLAISLDFAPAASHVVVLKGKLEPRRIAKSSMEVLSFDGEVIRGTVQRGASASAVIRKGRSTVNRRMAARRPLRPILLGRTFSFRTEEENVHCLSAWKMAIEAADVRREEYIQGPTTGPRWLSVTNGAWETQLPQERDEQTYPVTLWYRTSFDIGGPIGNMSLTIDGFSGSSFALFVNGSEIHDKGTKSSLDAEMSDVDISAQVRKGQNDIAVRLVVQRRTDGILDLLKLRGRFTAVNGSLVPAPGTIEIGDWTRQGYPTFSGTGVYGGILTVPKKYFDGRLMLEVECGEDVLEYSFNGRPTKVVPWHPYRVDVTDELIAGENTFELRVTNTLINVLEAVEKASGLLASPRLMHQPVYELKV